MTAKREQVIRRLKALREEIQYESADPLVSKAFRVETIQQAIEELETEQV